MDGTQHTLCERMMFVPHLYTSYGHSMLDAHVSCTDSLRVNDVQTWPYRAGWQNFKIAAIIQEEAVGLAGVARGFQQLIVTILLYTYLHVYGETRKGLLSLMNVALCVQHKSALCSPTCRYVLPNVIPGT